MLRKLLFVVPVVLAFTAVGAQALTNTPSPNVVVAPEFDARTSGAALALLVGGVLVLTERRRRRQAESH